MKFTDIVVIIMSFFDKLKDAGKKAGAKIKKGAEKELAGIRDRKKATEMLELLRKSELIKFCNEYGFEYEKSMNKAEIIENLRFSGGFRKLSSEKVSDYFNYIRKKIPNRFVNETIEEIEIEQEVIKTEKITTEKVTTKVKKPTRTKTKLRSHLSKFKPIVSRSFKEKDLEAQMVQSLRMVFGDNKVNYQERARGGRVDIVVDGKYAIELKVITSPSQLTSMVGQVSNYTREYQTVFVWMYDRKSQLKNKDIADLKQNLSHLKNVEIYSKR